MTISTVPFGDLRTLFNDLEELALSTKEIVFRGHRDANWKIETTLARYTSTPMHMYNIDLENSLLHFMYKISSIKTTPFNKFSRRAVLEYARHHGIPTPVVDFTWSPYVAAYFALGGVQWKHSDPAQNAAIIAIDMSNLALGWDKLHSPHRDAFQGFLSEDAEFFSKEFPSDTLKFIRLPASWNKRMQSQQGCFLYNSLDYNHIGKFKDIEDFISQIDEPIDARSGAKEPTMTKFIIPHSSVGDVLAKLEMTNINGINLLDHEGVAADVMSDYNYVRKSGYNWDIAFDHL